MHTRIVWSVLGLGLVFAVPARAQRQANLAVGARVRLAWRDSSARTVGEVRDLRGDTLVVGDSADGPETRVPLARLRSVEISRGFGQSAVLTSIGMFAGALLGGYAGFHLWSPGWEAEDEDNLFGQFFAWLMNRGPASGALLGAGLGAAILGGAGRHIERRERWESIRPEGLRLDLVPLPAGRVGLGASIHF